MIADAKEAAKTLGFDQKSWDKDKDTDSTIKEWAQLSDKEKKAAGVLGYNEQNWNDDFSSSSDEE